MDLSPVAEDYLKAIYHLENDHGEPVRTAEISDAVGVTSPTVSSMVDTLDERDLVEYTPYEGVELTDQGERVVLRLVRNHRLLETFLAEHLDVPWADVHDEADRLEHHVSDEFVARLAEFLGHPTTDPHGDPIPDSEFRLPEESPYDPLTTYDPGERLVVEQVPHRDPDIREYLSDHGIGPGTRLVVEEVSAVDLVTVVPTAGENPVPLPTRVARRIGVRPTT
ncbi:metal-dependent transcriptional regulator [Natronobacterium texcoconense]|uniref:Iron (Metal) dependent repressor, DtxR family n=1 Tax=Natronobacterium texcoconense TaxID=1095778 RepID=A0A1H1IF81_NATTX|nr:metal-dependent transcriptional regulator [Natronobacterium texcoconense]SDR36387.1 iron (metal) dependent repressor, DtxR family [Natronobacterium texcoconense]